MHSVDEIFIRTNTIEGLATQGGFETAFQFLQVSLPSFGNTTYLIRFSGDKFILGK